MRISCDFVTRSGSTSHSAVTFDPGMWTKRSTALGPRMPRPMKPTLTVSMGSAAKPTMSVTPAGRSGTVVLIVSAPAAMPAAAVKASAQVNVFLRFIFTEFSLIVRYNAKINFLMLENKYLHAENPPN